MTTYTDAAHAALIRAERPVTTRELYDETDTFESAEQLAKCVAQLVKTGKAECVGMTAPAKGNARRIYRALTPDEQIERQPSAPDDLDQQLAAAIRERDTEAAEAVIEPMVGEWPDALEERPDRPMLLPEYDPNDVSFKRPDGLIDVHPPRNGLRMIETDSDPIINAMHRMQIGKPQIQGIETDIRRARELSRVIGDAGPDVIAWLSELADKLEARA